MTSEPIPTPHPLQISVVDAEAERARLRAELDRFEERYLLPSSGRKPR